MKILITIALTTMLTRFLAFVLFQNKTMSNNFLKIIDALPYATISLLLVYGFKDTNSSNLAATILASLICILSYHFKRSSIISIVLSTIVYMSIIKLL